VLAPLLLLAGAGLGLLWTSRSPVRVYTEAPPPETRPEPRAQGQVAGPLPSFAPVVAKVRAGVVRVRTILQSNDTVSPSGSTGVESGTGFVVNASGLIVTNQHVIAGYQLIMIDFPSGTTIEADVVGEDPVADLAVLRLREVPPGLQVLRLGDSRGVQQGDWVIAVSNPFEFNETVQVGIVSYVGRHLPEEGTLVSNEHLQLSIALLHGSSGCPIFDAQGNVIGVSRRALAEGHEITFAVPSKVLMWVLDQMERNNGRVRRGYLGIRFEPFSSAAVAERPGMRSHGGALIRRVLSGQPGANAGLQEGDVILSWNGKPIDSAYELYDFISYAPPESRATLEVLRGGQRLAPITVTLGELPESGR
jgi:serine protease Do